MQAHLQCVDEHAPFGTAPQGPVAFLPGEIQRRGVGPEGGLAVRDQYESRFFVEAPAPGVARLFESPERTRHRRNRRDLVPEILQETTGRAAETSPETGWPGREAGALPGTGSGSGGPGSLGSDVRCD